MPDDLDLRLRTAKALGWVLDGPAVEQNGIRIEMYRRDWDDPCFFVQYRDDAIIGCSYMPDYPASLGACAEVLEEMDARSWEYESWSGIEKGVRRHWFHIMRRDENNERAWVAEAWADSRTAAICLAFCQAVEASGNGSAG